MNRAMIRPILGCAAALFLVASGALAQAPQARNNAAGEAHPQDQNAPEHFDSQAKKPGEQSKSLSQRLDQSNGVIKPPANVDPEIHETPPPTRDNNVITPPAAQQAQPK